MNQDLSTNMRVTAVVLTHNEAHHVVPCLESLRWADHRLVVDDFSANETAELARKTGAKVVQHALENFSRQRNFALEAAGDTDWILFVDADERATPDVAQEVRRVVATGGPEVGWWIPRHNYIFGHRMRGAGWWPDYQLRLLRQGHATYDPHRAVHEEATLDGPAGHLEHPLVHHNYESWAQFHATQRRYTDYDAGILVEKGVRPHPYTPYTQIPRHFWWRFFTLGGWRDGLYGILLSGLMAYYEMVKYRKVRRKVGGA
jgi:hypothetical protein